MPAGTRGRLAPAWRALVGDLDAASTALVLGAAGTTALGVGRTTRGGVGVRLATAAVAFDLAGGLVAFQLPATRARYAPTSVGSRLLLTGVHVQPLLLPLLGQGRWADAGRRYAAAQAATAALELALPTSPRRRLVANALAATLSAVDAATAQGPQRWIGPVFLMKLVGGHAGIPRTAR